MCLAVKPPVNSIMVLAHEDEPICPCSNPTRPWLTGMKGALPCVFHLMVVEGEPALAGDPLH